MPNLLDARIQLEGGLERLEAWSEDFAAVRADLASPQWQSWLAAHGHVWDRLIAHEQELQSALAKVRALAETNRPLERWLARWDKKRSAVFVGAQKRGVRANTFAHLFAALKQVPVPARIEFDNRRTLWDVMWANPWAFDRSHPDGVVVTTELIVIEGQPAAFLDEVEEVVFRNEHRTISSVIVRLKDGGTRRTTIDGPVEPLAAALARVNVRVRRV